MKIVLIKVARVGAWVVGINAVIFAGLVIIDLAKTPQRTANTVAAIHAQRLTMVDVDGKHLPPTPDPELVDATVEGIDVNKNGIRDDVELAIFKKFPKAVHIRAAELQYAMALQRYLTSVFNTDTWREAAVMDSRGYACISLSYPRTERNAHDQVVTQRIEDVETLVFNTAERVSAQERANSFTTSTSLAEDNFCDINF